MRKVVCLFAALFAAAAAPAGQTTVTLLATTDLHGNIFPADYYSGQPANRGLAKIGTLIRAARAGNPNTVLIDCGDTIQGTPLESLYQRYLNTGRLPGRLAFAGPPLAVDPMMLAMNELGYQAMVLGNHDFNFGLKSLARARADAHFPWLSANTETEPGAAVKPFDPCLVISAGGPRIGIVGITTPAIPYWEKPENYAGYRFRPALAAARRAVAEMRERRHPEIVVLAVHAGLDSPAAASVPDENMVRLLASEISGVDAIVYGHTHREAAGDRVGDVLLVQPKNWGGSLARIDFRMEDSSGAWKLVKKDSRLIPVTAATAADPGVASLIRPYHELTERYLNTPVAQSPVAMDGRWARYEDSPLLDAVQQVQLHYAQADVSFTALFNAAVTIPKGPVTVRQIAALYIYENQLYAVEGTGRMVKEALENAARYFLSCPDPECSHGPLLRQDVPGFNYDIAEGVDYQIDLTKPEGARVTKLLWKGRPLQPDQKLRIAINNYRAGGSAGYQMFRGAKVLWRSSEDIRDLIIAYYSERGKLPGRATGNWRLVPPQAVRLLEQ